MSARHHWLSLGLLSLLLTFVTYGCALDQIALGPPIGSSQKVPGATKAPEPDATAKAGYSGYIDLDNDIADYDVPIKPATASARGIKFTCSKVYIHRGDSEYKKFNKINAASHVYAVVDIENTTNKDLMDYDLWVRMYYNGRLMSKNDNSLHPGVIHLASPYDYERMVSNKGGFTVVTGGLKAHEKKRFFYIWSPTPPAFYEKDYTLIYPIKGYLNIDLHVKMLSFGFLDTVEYKID